MKNGQTMLVSVLSLLVVMVSMVGCGNVAKAKPDRSPQNIGKVLVFGGTGWYRHPETPAVSGWLSRLTDELVKEG